MEILQRVVDELLIVDRLIQPDLIVINQPASHPQQAP
jgi:hypothetical protein